MVGHGGLQKIVGFSNLHLWMSTKCVYCAAIVFICLNVFLISVTYNFVFKFSIDDICVVVLVPTNSTMNGATFHPLVVILLMSGWYLVLFLSRGYAINLLLQFANSINCIVSSGVKVSGGGLL